jgi:hypothetical protein
MLELVALASCRPLPHMFAALCDSQHRLAKKALLDFNSNLWFCSLFVPNTPKE